MKRPGALLALLLALLWAPATSHCLLEHAGWIAHSSCCTTHDDSNAGGGDDHGADDADCCALVSNGVDVSKRLSSGESTAPPDTSPVPLPVLSGDAFARFTGSLHARDISPRWRFALRTALPPRAPSC